MLLFGQVQNGFKVFEKRGFHQGRVLYFMHERHPNVEENRKRIGIVGGSICAGQVHKGVKQAPDQIRKGGLIESLEELGYDVKDYGNITEQRSAETSQKEMLGGKERVLRNPEEVAIFNGKLSETVRQIKDDKRVVCVLGGDHSVGIGSIHGHMTSYGEKEEPCVLWVDAHADINTIKSSESGSMHGMPMSFHIKEVYQENKNLKHMEWFQPTLTSKNVAYIGLRSVDPEEKKVLDDLNISVFSMREIDDLGIKEVARQALKIINPQFSRPLHVSFDIDVLDPSEAPATGTPVPGGLTMREAATLMEECFFTGCLEGLDVVEVNTELARNDGEASRSVDCAKRIVLAAFGKTRVGTSDALKL